ncbi:unnamed protein product [Ascophyllum nodosum]
MTVIGFEQSKADSCVFRKAVDGKVEMVRIVHMNNILAHAVDQATRERFAVELGRKFKLKHMGDAKYYIVCHIIRDRKLMVEKVGVEKASRISASSAVPTLLKADEPQTPEEKEEMSKFPYREAVGAHMWTATTTRLNIACAVRPVARFCEICTGA